MCRGCANAVPCEYLAARVFRCGLKSYVVYPATDMLLEELALNPAGSNSVPEKKSNAATNREVKTKRIKYELLQFCLNSFVHETWHSIERKQLKKITCNFAS